MEFQVPPETSVKLEPCLGITDDGRVAVFVGDVLHPVLEKTDRCQLCWPGFPRMCPECEIGLVHMQTTMHMNDHREVLTLKQATCQNCGQDWEGLG